MKKIQNTVNKPKKSLMWLWIVFAFIFGCAIGYITHYFMVNEHCAFALCPDGKEPDKNGCCEGEVYTDAGGGWMVCCPEGEDSCFPAMTIECK